MFLGFFPSFFIIQNDSKTVIDKTSLAYTGTVRITVHDFLKW